MFPVLIAKNIFKKLIMIVNENYPTELTMKWIVVVFVMIFSKQRDIKVPEVFVVLIIHTFTTANISL